MKNITLSNIKYNEGSIKDRKRVGRGRKSGHGVKCGKGSNGNKQRSGHKYKPGFEGGQTPLKKKLPMIRRINKFRTDKPVTVTTDNLELLINNNITEINSDILKKYKLIRGEGNYKVVLGKKEEINYKNVKITANGFSEKAKLFIEKSGGECILADKNITNK